MTGSDVHRRSTRTLLWVGLLGIGLAAGAGDPAFAQSSGAWMTTGAMNVPRSNHTATLLPNGQVLVAGGAGANSTTLSSAELFNPATGKWTLTGSMSTPRSSHRATLLPDGHVLVAGGSNPTYLSSAELYDPATGQWSTTGAMTTPRAGHGAALLEDGQVLVAGGLSFGVGTATAELYDPAKGSWRPTASMPYSVATHATRLQNGNVLLPGASNRTGEVYDPSTQSWSLTSTMYFTQPSTDAVLLPNGDVLIFGSPNSTTYSSEFYDPSTNVWARTFGQNFTNILVGPIALLASGKALVAGGASTYHSLSRAAALFDSSTSRWGLTGGLNQFRRNHTLTALANGQALVAGGVTLGSNGSAVVIGSAEVYTP